MWLVVLVEQPEWVLPSFCFSFSQLYLSLQNTRSIFKGVCFCW